MNNQPFFAKFLENQLEEQENNHIKGGVKAMQTMKFPSDGDE
ncbi:MAG: microviridin/marinostatin family tricyclic proteinase inhibitor [Chitinophagales bacterium]